MNAPLPQDDVAEATRTVRRLDEQAEGLRAELSLLQQTLAELHGDLGASHAADLLQANEQLVLAALHADTIAETAVDKLDELARSSQRDVLTGTPNRTLMLDRINGAITLARRHRSKCALIFLDVDRFKPINDQFGHDVGDEVIKLVAQRLQSCVRQADTVGRHGGDEFLVLLSEVLHKKDVALVAAKILASLAAPTTISGHLLSLSASLGIAICPDDGGEPAELIRHADAAMYHSKQRGHGGFEFHSIEMPAGRARATRDNAALRTLARGENPSGASGLRLRDLRDANESLVLRTLAAQETERQRGEQHQRQIRFLAMVAHELRSPLAPLGTAAELLKHAVADAPLLARLQTIIKRQVAHMTRLVEDLLDGSRTTTGKFRLDRLPVVMAPVIAQAVEACRPRMEARQQSFSLQGPGSGITVRGDAVRLAQVFSNLLDNASKYTMTGGSIRLAAHELDGQLVVAVTDNGIGITAEALPTIFELFVQEEHAVLLDRSGLGIGLAVVRDLVTAHGGSVVCSSAGRNRGSEFTVTLPVLTDERPATH
jgi:diguanylate cyclase